METSVANYSGSEKSSEKLSKKALVDLKFVFFWVNIEKTFKQFHQNRNRVSQLEHYFDQEWIWSSTGKRQLQTPFTKLHEALDRAD